MPLLLPAGAIASFARSLRRAASAAVALAISVAAHAAPPTVITGAPALDRTAPANLVTNGSFETAGSCPSADPDPKNGGYWGAITTLTPTAAVPGWNTSGGSNATYAIVVCDPNAWGSAAGWHGSRTMYFGNAFSQGISETPTGPTADGRWIFSAPPTITGSNGPGTEVVLSQTIATVAGRTYRMSFWTAGEGSRSGAEFNDDGVMAVDITGSDRIHLAIPNLGGRTYTLEFVATGAATTISFINWGHFAIQTGYFGRATPGWTRAANTTELNMDDVIVNQVSSTYSITGRVFEDVNYGGGAGRSYAAAAGAGVAGARVELYDGSGNFVSSTNTAAGGTYSFTGLADGNYTVRTASGTVTSTRTLNAGAGTLLPVQTFRTNGVSANAGVADTNRVGGENACADDAASNVTSAALASLTSGTQAGAGAGACAGQPQTVAQSVAPVTVSGADVSGIDFGYSFNVVSNVRDSGLGSLRQFITNANGLGNGSLAIVGQSAGKDVSIFMIPDGSARPGLRLGMANQLTSGVAVITPQSALPGFSDTDTTLDGGTQTSNVGDTNSGQLGTGGTVGVDGIALSRFDRPEVQIVGGGAGNGLSVDASNTTIRNVAIHGHAIDIVVNTGDNTLIERNFIGITASALAQPTPRTSNNGVRVWNGGRTGIVRNNLAGFTTLTTINFRHTNAAGFDWQVTGNEVVGGGHNGIEVDSGAAPVADVAGTMTIRGNLVRGMATQGIGIDFDYPAASSNTVVKTVDNNTITGSGAAGIYVIQGDASNTLSKNVITQSAHAGIFVGDSGVTYRATDRTRITQNSIYANTGIGIDLSNSMTTSAIPGVSGNDGALGRPMANNGMDYPIFTSASLVGTTLTVSGYVGNSAAGSASFASAAIEIFAADNTPGNNAGEVIAGDGLSVAHGEGRTYLCSITADALGRFNTSCTIGGPALAAAAAWLGHALGSGDAITATATDASGNTSEFGANVAISAATIDVVKSAGVPNRVAAGRYEIPYAIVVGNKALVPAPNVQVVDNLALTFPTAMASAGGAGITIKAGSFSVANGAGTSVCAGPGTAYNGTTQLQLLSGSFTLGGGESCVIGFVAIVDFGSNAVPTAAQNNAAYASTIASGPNTGHTFAGGTATAPAGAITVDRSTNVVAAAGGTAGAIPAAPALPGSANGDAASDTPVLLTGSASLSGSVWIDATRNRTRDAGETGVPNFGVELLDRTTRVYVPCTPSNSTLGCVTMPDSRSLFRTDANGNYDVQGLAVGTYEIRFRDSVNNVAMGTPVNGSSTPAAAVDASRQFITLTVAAGSNYVDQSLPIDPSGVVYDVATRAALAGAIVTFCGPPNFNPGTMLVGSGYAINGACASMTAGASGLYQFLLGSNAPSGQYTLAANLSGYTSPAPSIPAAPGALTPPIGSGPYAIQPQTGPPQAGASTTYYLALNLAPGLRDVVNNHIPMERTTALALFVEKTASAQTVELGDSVLYTVRVRNPNAVALASVVLSDRLPLGFRFIAKTLRVAGASAADPAGAPGPLLTIPVGTIAAGGTAEITYRVRVGVGAMQGDGINRARASSTGGTTSNEATARVRVSGGVFTNEACVVGKIFVDCNGNSTQDPEELGIPGVRLYFSDGTYVISDSEGKYSYCGLPPRLMGFKADRTTLPKGSRLTTSSNRNALDAGSLFLDLKFGELHRADFIEGSCTPEVLNQVKARRAQGEIRAPETERKNGPPLIFDSRNGPLPITRERVDRPSPTRCTTEADCRVLPDIPLGAGASAGGVR